jgi:O-antigen/teichoic acid export membrane protein
MEEEKSSYRSIMKATSLFGGVQVLNILITIVRSKIVAVLLGPAGMGIMGLLNSTTGLVQSLTNFGLGTSAVRDISAANESNDFNRISKITIVFRRLVWITGLLGTLSTFLLAPWLSELSFGNKEYTIAFRWLATSLLLNQLATGQNVILQGTRQLKYLAKANLLGSLIGLLITAPLYYLMGIDGIVPAIIIMSITSFLIAWYYGDKVKITNVKVTSQETIFEGNGMLKMGFMISLSSLITLCVSYVVRIYISNTGGLEDVGLYNAGFAIIGTYVGLIFAAMGTDFYPRLSGIANDNQKATTLINQQAVIAVLIISPILTVFFIFIDWVILVLYSPKFFPVNGLIQWAALGMYFKTVSWCIAFVFLAKGVSKLFFWNELITNAYLLLFNILGYKFFGLTGMGISFLVSYILYLVQVYFIAKFKYEFSFIKQFFKIFSVQLLLGILCFIIKQFIPTPWNYIIGLPFIAFSTLYSIKELDKRMGLIILFKEKFKNK